MLRIDPLGGTGAPYSYGIPASNPFANDMDPTMLDEIYAYGFRNGHRIAWDLVAGGAPFVCDIGEDNLEEINRLAPGANYGWPDREGSYALDVAVDPSVVFALPGNDASLGYSYPVAQYDHEEGKAIAGGFVYRGSAPSALDGEFLFGDIATGRMFYASAAEMVAADDGDPTTTAQLYELTLFADGEQTTLLDLVRAELSNPALGRVDLRFGTDADGVLYATTKQDGFVRRLIAQAAEPVPALPFFAWLALAGLLLAVARQFRAPTSSLRR
jgi:glucose/arabinose dehydrogenase